MEEWVCVLGRERENMEEEARGGFTLHPKTGRGSQHITLIKMNTIQHKMNGMWIKKNNIMIGCLEGGGYYQPKHNRDRLADSVETDKKDKTDWSRHSGVLGGSVAESRRNHPCDTENLAEWRVRSPQMTPQNHSMQYRTWPPRSGGALQHRQFKTGEKKNWATPLHIVFWLVWE